MVTASNLIYLDVTGMMFDDVRCHRDVSTDMRPCLVNEHQRVGGLRLLQALDDLPRHGSNLDFTRISNIFKIHSRETTVSTVM